jgi:hypothetical protein
MKTMIGKIVNIDNKFLVQTESSLKSYNILNKTPEMLYDGSGVEFTLVCINQHKNRYKAYITKVITPQIDYLTFIKLINIAITTRINKEDILFNKYIDKVSVEDLSVNTRRMEVVISRNMAIYFTNKYLGQQLRFSDIGKLYNRTRSMIYRSLEAIESYKLDKKLKNILEYLEKEIELIYKNLKK